MHNPSLFLTIIPIEINFTCTQWTYDSFRDTTVYEISGDVYYKPNENTSETQITKICASSRYCDAVL